MQNLSPVPPEVSYPELTWRGMLLAAVMTIIFTASNVYLGLKVGLTFSSSIPAAVISMAILSSFAGSNILENNIVQTQASAAGAQSAIIFALPALIIVGYWQNFSFFETTLIVLAGSMLGVIFSIPLRRALVVNSKLPYPEGVAAAEILRVGSKIKTLKQSNNLHANQSTGALEIFFGGLFAAIVNLLTNGFQLLSGSYAYWINTSYGSVFQIPLGFSFAITGAGYLIGITIGSAIFFGLFLAWGIIVPYLTATTPIPSHFVSDLPGFAMMIWQTKVRLIGAGVMTIGALWTIIALFKPLVEGLKVSFDFTKKPTTQRIRTDQDLSPHIMLRIMFVTILLLIAAFYYFAHHLPITQIKMGLLIGLALIFTLVIGFLVTSVCGYMAGLLGSSSSPISGIAIICIIASSLTLLIFDHYIELTATQIGSNFIVAFAIFITSVILTIACIANDNLQDLNTGYLIGATPWRQQVALLIGCIIGSLVIAPIIELIYQAYGLIGAMPRSNMDPTQALVAPQATLIATIATGIFTGSTNWSMIYIGIAIGIVLIIADQFLQKTSWFRLSALAVGIGLYLPPTIVMPLVVGTILGWLIDYRLRKKSLASHQNHSSLIKIANQRGGLFASGLIVGESLIGVCIAIVIVISVTSGGSDAPLSLLVYLNKESYLPISDWLGLIVFIVSCCFFVYKMTAIKNTDTKNKHIN